MAKAFKITIELTNTESYDLAIQLYGSEEAVAAHIIGVMGAILYEHSVPEHYDIDIDVDVVDVAPASDELTR